MKSFFKKIWDAIAGFFCRISYDALQNFIIGALIASFFAIALGMKFCFWPVIFAGFIKVFYNNWAYSKPDWKDMLAICIGGAVPQVFVLLNLWWF